MLCPCDEGGRTSPSQLLSVREPSQPGAGIVFVQRPLVWYFVLISHPDLALLIPALAWLVRGYPGTL